MVVKGSTTTLLTSSQHGVNFEKSPQLGTLIRVMDTVESTPTRTFQRKKNSKAFDTGRADTCAVKNF